MCSLKSETVDTGPQFYYNRWSKYMYLKANAKINRLG